MGRGRKRWVRVESGEQGKKVVGRDRKWRGGRGSDMQISKAVGGYRKRWIGIRSGGQG